ncbi:MAG: class I SAM-dependent methyltransferase [Candidatus Taylorbacteria bacterium]|nr:class I SAM-dependent methyltransferase [Candidatus Taylorbacteria bacterium]
MKSKDTSWGKVADWYDGLIEESPDSYQSKVILPNLLRLIDPKKGLAIADVACGQGFFSRAFHEKGAIVVGCDISEELIKVAKERSSKEIKFIVKGAEVCSDDLLKVVEDRKLDTAVIVLAIQNIEKIADVFAECKKILKPDGKLFIVINHPAFRIPQASSWEWDGKIQRQFRRIDSYMSDSQISIDMTPGEKKEVLKKKTISFHRPLQSYFKALSKSGFVISKLEEWISHKKSEEGPRAIEEDRTRKEIPLFMCIEARRAI